MAGRTATSDVEALGAFSTVSAFRRDPLGLYGDIARMPRGMARTNFLGTAMLMITDPKHVHHVLQENGRNYDKNAPMYKNARPFLGNGITITPGGEDWLFRRRLMQPVFHHDHIRLISDVTEQCLADVLAERRRLAETGRSLDVALEMTTLTMRIVCRTLFGTDVAESSVDIARRFDDIVEFAIRHLTMPFPPLFVPTRANRRFHANVRQVEEFVEDVISERRSHPGSHGDLLSLLVGLLDGSQGTDGRPVPGMTMPALRDELIGLFFAGHETLASTMAWCWYLLASHPAVDAELCRELEKVLGGRPATVADLPDLTYTKLVVEEAMRLYPVIWVNMRRAIDDDEIDGVPVPAGTVVAWSPYVGNRLPEYWDAPNEFRPERFRPENAAGRDRRAFAPFGAGARFCIGAGFANAEAVLILATLAQEHQLRLVSPEPAVPAQGFTLFPRDGVWATLTQRG